MEASSEALGVDSGTLEDLFKSIKSAKWRKSKLQGLSEIQEVADGPSKEIKTLAGALIARRMVLLTAYGDRDGC